MPHTAAEVIAPARGSSSVRCSGRRSSSACHELRRAGDARLLSRRPRFCTRGKPARTSSRCFRRRRSGPATSRTCAARCRTVRLMPTGGVTRDNAGDWIRAGAVAIGVGTALVDRDGRRRRADSTSITRERACVRRCRRSARGRRAGGSERDEDRLLRRDHAAAEPAGLRAAVPVAARCRRRSAAGKRTSPSAWRSSAATATTSRACRANPIGDAAMQGAARRRRATSSTCSAAASRLGIYFAETGASQRPSTVIYDRAHSAISEMAPGQRAVGTTSSTARRGSTGPASRRRSARRAAACTREAIEAARRAGARGQRRSQLPTEAVVRARGAADDAAARAARRSS